MIFAFVYVLSRAKLFMQSVPAKLTSRILQSCPCISYLHDPFYATFAAAKYRQAQVVHPPRRINH